MGSNDEVKERDGIRYRLVLVSDLQPGMRSVAWNAEGEMTVDEIIEAVTPGTIYGSTLGPQQGFYIKRVGNEHVSSAGRFYRAAIVVEEGE